MNSMPTFQPHGRISILYSRHLCYCSLNIYVFWIESTTYASCGGIICHIFMSVLKSSTAGTMSLKHRLRFCELVLVCSHSQQSDLKLPFFNNMCMRSKCLNLSHRTVMPYMESSLADLWFVNLVHRTRVVSVQSYLLQKNFTFSPICGMIQLSEWCIL